MRQFIKSLDPSGGIQKYQIPLTLDPGVLLVSATVTDVDTGDQPTIDGAIVVSNVTYATSAGADGNTGVTFYVRATTETIAGTQHRMRCRYRTNETPSGQGSDCTVLLRIEHL